MSRIKPILGTYLTKEELRTATPSRKDGIEYGEEKTLRKNGVVFQSGLGMEMKIPQVVISTASVYFHCFFARQSFKKYHHFDMALVCLFLATKHENKRQKSDSLIAAYYKTRKTWKDITDIPIADSADWEAMKEKMFTLELLLLDTLGYTFTVDHPYRYLIDDMQLIFGHKYANKPRVWQEKHVKGKGQLAQHAWNFVNDSYRSTVCLQFPAQEIAVAVIYLALTTTALKTVYKDGQDPASPDNVPWHEELFGCSKSLLESICREIMKALSTSTRSEHNLAIAEQQMYGKQVNKPPSNKKTSSARGDKQRSKSASSRRPGADHKSSGKKPERSSQNKHPRSSQSGGQRREEDRARKQKRGVSTAQRSQGPGSTSSSNSSRAPNSSSSNQRRSNSSSGGSTIHKRRRDVTPPHASGVSSTPPGGGGEDAFDPFSASAVPANIAEDPFNPAVVPESDPFSPDADPFSPSAVPALVSKGTGAKKTSSGVKRKSPGPSPASQDPNNNLGPSAIKKLKRELSSKEAQLHRLATNSPGPLPGGGRTPHPLSLPVLPPPPKTSTDVADGDAAPTFPLDLETQTTRGRPSTDKTNPL